MNGIKEFQTRTAMCLLVAVISGTIQKLPRFRDIPVEDVVAESFKTVKEKLAESK